MKQVFLSLIVIMAVASLAGVATYADFNDVETSPGNYFAMGSLDLQLGDTKPYPGGDYEYQLDEDYGQDPLGDSVEATWDYELGYGPGGMEPGEYLQSRVMLRNVGSVEATSLDISCYNVNTAPPPWDPSGDGPLDKDTKMIITELVYTCNSVQVDLLTDGNDDWRIDNVDGLDNITLNDWELDPIIGLTPPALEHEAAIRMTVLFDPDAGSNYMGCSTMMTLNFALTQ